MMAYTNVLRIRTLAHCFYNGNGFGQSGIGYAVAVDEPARAPEPAHGHDDPARSRRGVMRCIDSSIAILVSHLGHSFRLAPDTRLTECRTCWPRRPARLSTWKGSRTCRCSSPAFLLSRLVRPQERDSRSSSGSRVLGRTGLPPRLDPGIEIASAGSTGDGQRCPGWPPGSVTWVPKSGAGSRRRWDRGEFRQSFRNHFYTELGGGPASSVGFPRTSRQTRLPKVSPESHKLSIPPSG